VSPGWTKAQIRAVIRIILNHKTSKLKSSHIVNFTIPHLGKVKSHGNKKVKRYKPTLIADKKKKKQAYRKKLLSKNYLLWK
jgi:hypothetical protein